MATVRDRSAGITVGRDRPGAARPARYPLTLADLITAVQDVVGPEDDGLVVATVRHLLRSGRLIGRGTGILRCPPQPEETGWSHIVKRGGRHPSVVARRWRCSRRPDCRGSRGASGNAAAQLPARR
jgi:hypothetical protein